MAGLIELPRIGSVFLLITNRCNLRCAHCYVGSSPSGTLGISLERLCSLAQEIVTEFGSIPVSVSGGEPLVREADCFRLLDALSPPCPVILLTNATLISTEVAKQLATREISVRVSVDVGKEPHDLLRGPGTYERALLGVDNLLSAGLRGDLMAIHAAVLPNAVGEIENLLELVNDRGIRELRLDELRPLGRGQDLWSRLDSGASPGWLADAIHQCNVDGWVIRTLNDGLGEHFRTINIFSDGEVYLTPNRIDGEGIGNILEGTLHTILSNSDRVSEAILRRVVRHGRSVTHNAPGFLLSRSCTADNSQHTGQPS